MTKEAALYAFFSTFGIPAYAETSVPSDAEFPYLTYSLTTAAFGEGDVNITVNLWYYTDSETVVNAKAREIGTVIGRGGRIVFCDDGAIWIKRGSPFSQAVEGQGDNDKIKRRYINVDLEYITEN